MGKRKTSKLTFTLTGIDVEGILQYHYGGDVAGVEQIDGDIEKTTILDLNDDIGVSDILHEKGKISKRSILFLDPHKSEVKLWGNMLDLTSQGPLPRFTNMPCWWCRNRFSTHPIGCPIRYVQCSDEIEEERIKERFAEMNLSHDSGYDFFETEGIFCTFPCVKAYILDEMSRTKSEKYKISMTLLTLLYQKFFGELIIIPTAGSWRTGANWGGHLTPSEYRASTGLLEYTETVNTHRPYMYSSSNWIRERRIRI